MRIFTCLDKNLLRKNCFAPVGRVFSRDFCRDGRRLTGVRQGHQGEKRRKESPTGGVCSTPQCLSKNTWHLPQSKNSTLSYSEIWIVIGHQAKEIPKLREIDEYIHF